MLNTTLPCVLMRAGTSRGPFFLRDWLPPGDDALDQALIGAIGASDPLQLDGLGGGSTLNSKVAIVSRSSEPDCDVDYLFAQVGVGHQSVDRRPNCGNMLSGVGPFAIEQGLVQAQDGTTTVRVFNVNTRSRIHVTVCTPGRRVTYEGDTRIDGVAGTAAPIFLNFLEAWGAVTGQVFPTGQRKDLIDGIEVTCIDAAMPLMIVRAQDMGVSGREKPAQLDANDGLMARLEQLRLQAGELMGLGDVSISVIPKPVLVSVGESPNSITSRYFTPKRCHASHAVTGAIGVATALALPGTVASGSDCPSGTRQLSILHPAGQIDVEVKVEGEGASAQIVQAALVRTARKIFQGELNLPPYVFPRSDVLAEGVSEATSRSSHNEPRRSAAPRTLHLIVPTTPGGANDTIARAIARKLGPVLGQTVVVDTRSGANGSIASEFVAKAAPDGQTLLFGYIATHALNPALQPLRYDPIRDFVSVGRVGISPTLLIVPGSSDVRDVRDLIGQIQRQTRPFTYASAGDGTAPHFAAELFQLATQTHIKGRAYAGSAPAISDIANGGAQLMFPSLFTAHPYLETGKVKALAVAGHHRLPSHPHLPSLRETGIEGVELAQWYALFAPSGTPPDIVLALNQALNQVLDDNELKLRIQEEGLQLQPSTPAELDHLLRLEQSKWRAVVRQAHLRPSMETDDQEVPDEMVIA